MAEELAERIGLALRVQLVNAVLGNERIARELGLLVTDLQTLHLLLLRPDIRTPRRLSEVSGLPTSTVTRVADRLEEAGYLRRVPDHADRRRTILELVPDRVAVIGNHYERYAKAYRELNAQFTDEELAVVARYLELAGSFF